METSEQAEIPSSQEKCGSIGQSEKPSPHVHFSEESEGSFHSNEIVVRSGRTSHAYEIQLGFLQVGHTYEVIVKLPPDVSTELQNLNLNSFQQKDVPVPIHCKLVTLSREADSPKLVFQFKALHDKVTREKMILVDQDNETSLQFNVVARVLGRGKGTPMLRSGIKCIAVEPVDNTDESDWQGF